MVSILHISRTMGQGGAEKIVFQLSQSLKDEFENTVIASSGGQLVDELTRFGINHVEIFDIETKNIVKIIKNFVILRNVVRDLSITHIHAHHRMGLVYCKMLKVIYPNISFLYTAHNIFSTHNGAYRKLINGIEIIAVGKSVKNHLINDVKVNDELVRIIYNGVQYDHTRGLLDQEYLNFDGVKILCVARLAEQKGIKYLLEAMKLIENLDFKLYIIGDGDLYGELKEFVEKSKISNKVQFLGFRRNVQDYIRECKFMVMPSLWEGFPLTPIECFMFQKTIIATNISGIDEIVNDRNGILVEPKNPLQLANAIEYLLKNPSTIDSKGFEGFQIYQKNFSYEQFIDGYRKLYFKELL